MLLAVALVCFLAQVAAWLVLPATVDVVPATISADTESMETMLA